MSGADSATSRLDGSADGAPDAALRGASRDGGPATSRARRVVMPEEIGPILVEGPVEVVLDDGTTCVSNRPLVALCACRRSQCYPFCDTSHRRHSRPPAARAASGSATVRPAAADSTTRRAAERAAEDGPAGAGSAGADIGAGADAGYGSAARSVAQRHE